MELLFYLHASAAVMAMGIAMVATYAIHALLYTVLSLLCLAVSMYLLSAPLAGALEAIIYGGAIMVLFIFAVMLLQTPGKNHHEPGFDWRRFSLGIAVFGLFW